MKNYLEIEEEMTKTYNAIAEKYKKEAKADWENKEEVDKFLKYLNENASILDVACGTGELLEYYASKGFETTGIDISEIMVEISRDRVPSANIINMSLYDIEKIEEKFDGISATFILVHIPKEKISEVICSIKEKLNNNGVIFLTFTTSLKEGLQPEPLDNNYKFFAVNYSVKEVCNILNENGFNIVQSKEKRRENESGIGIIIAKNKMN